MNRRMRNRTSGGVGGRREQSRLLPDQIAKVSSRFSFWTIFSLRFAGLFFDCEILQECALLKG